MKHVLHCDNCGVELVTYCFGKNYTYYTPPLESVPFHKGMSLGDRIVQLATAAMTTLCDDCCNQ